MPAKRSRTWLGVGLVAAAAAVAVSVQIVLRSPPAGAPPALVARSSARPAPPRPSSAGTTPAAPAARPPRSSHRVPPPDGERSTGRGTTKERTALPAGLHKLVAEAAALATQRGLRAGIAVLDTRTGRYASAGEAGSEFGTASVVKVLIAAYLLANDELHGSTADLAYSMITRSDDDAASVLWGQVGGPEIEPWIEQHYDLPGLGSPNSIPGRWGNTHVTPLGLVRLYAKLQQDPAVWPWLGNAMHHANRVAKDGTDQFFGLPAVDPGAAVKQGWGSGSADADGAATVNTTGYVGHDRYAVAILTEGAENNDTTDARGYNAAQASVVTAMARLLAPIAG